VSGRNDRAHDDPLVRQIGAGQQVGAGDDDVIGGIETDRDRRHRAVIL